MGEVSKIRPGVIVDAMSEMTGSGGPPYDGGMEPRVAALEARLDTILPTLATKADLAELRSEMHEGFAGIVKWIVGVGVAGIAVVISVLTFYVNTAQRSPAAPQVQPIVINLSGAATLDGVSVSGGVRSPSPAGQASK